MDENKEIDEKRLKNSEDWFIYKQFRDLKGEIPDDVDLHILESLRSFFKPIAKGMSFGCTEIYGMYSLLKLKKAKQIALYFLLMLNEKVIKTIGLQ